MITSLRVKFENNSAGINFSEANPTSMGELACTSSLGLIDVFSSKEHREIFARVFIIKIITRHNLPTIPLLCTRPSLVKYLRAHSVNLIESANVSERWNYVLQPISKSSERNVRQNAWIVVYNVRANLFPDLSRIKMFCFLISIP